MSATYRKDVRYFFLILVQCIVNVLRYVLLFHPPQTKRERDLMDFVSKTTMPLCNYDGCHKESANYGLIQGERLFCKEHKTFDMINLTNNICKEEDCDTIPVFGIEGGVSLRLISHLRFSNCMPT